MRNILQNRPAVRGERWSRKALVFAAGLVLIALIVVGFAVLGHPSV